MKKQNYDFCIILNGNDIKRMGRDGISDVEAEREIILKRYQESFSYIKRVEVFYKLNTDPDRPLIKT